jgi:hypothetical protein
VNDLIEELAKQAFGSTIDTDPILVYEAEKFAMSIVKKCINIVDDAERGGSNEVWDNAVKFIRQDLQEHFGVQEQTESQKMAAAGYTRRPRGWTKEDTE